MPEVVLHLVWPDGSTDRLYSPSRAITDHLTPGMSYALADFLARGRAGLAVASARVEARYGMPCSRAHAESIRVERRAAAFASDLSATVRIVSEPQTGVSS